MSEPIESKAPLGEADVAAAHHDTVDHAADLDEKANIFDFKTDAIGAEIQEHDMGVLEAVRAYPAASWWAFVASFTIIMESYCVFLMGSFVTLPAFVKQFGEVSNVSGSIENHIITFPWQSAFQCGGPIGALIGVIIAGPITSKIGYRWSFIGGLMVLNAFIFIFFFAKSLGVLLASQVLEGIPWGIFIANAPAYCSEIVPLRLRAPATQMLQMFWAFGSIIVGAVCYHYQGKSGSLAYRIPIALQWMFPTPLAILIWWGPESPWWLTRKGRFEDAAKAVARLGRRKFVSNHAETVAMMRRTIELEKNEKEPNFFELWRGTDLYRTLIVCGVYAAQNLTGNLIANQATYFFVQAGMSTNTAFALGLITSALQAIFVMLSWILTTYLGRRTIYVWGSFINCIFLLALGIAASVGKSYSASLAQASLGLIVSVGFCLGPAPASWVIIGETSAIRLRPLTTGIGRGCYYIINIPCIFLGAYMLNPTGGDLIGKSGYVWAGTAFVCFLLSWIYIPEMKHRSYREIDILFRRKVPARHWKETVVDREDDE